MTDTISDMLTRIRNASRALLPEVTIPHSKMKESIARVLKREGYVVEVSVDGVKATKAIKIKLKYNGRKSIIEGVRRISSPGLRRYTGSQDVPRVRAGMGTSILSTSEGIMTGVQARKKNVGGELLCEIW
ncbi:MAG TPA: 30S ribosomal protein S8 [Candidatus Saccharimonadales bacterium]|jgi:small subunit ribosomal protein S8|nr:30S ribosomal protein S8 [Candidatus Saccharimonadales bacterium]